MKRRPLNLLTLLPLLLCVAVVALWVRSHRSPYKVLWHDFGDRAASVEASGGMLYLACDVTGPARYVYPTVGPTGGFAGFTYGTTALGSWVTVPLWFVSLWAALLSVAALRRARRRPTRGLCTVCGYDLRATPVRCPECGALSAVSESDRPQVARTPRQSAGRNDRSAAADCVAPPNPRRR